MKIPISTLLIFICTFESDIMLLFDFNQQSDLSNWRVVDDGVMGGLSQGRFSVDENGHAVFSGTVSLENYGGFSSVRHRFDPLNVQTYSKILLKIKGDGKRYQFRVKTRQYDRQSYIQYFTTTGDWQTIEISLDELYPTFRGRRLNIPNYPGEQMGEVAFLIGNKKAEQFQLVIDKIELH